VKEVQGSRSRTRLCVRGSCGSSPALSVARRRDRTIHRPHP